MKDICVNCGGWRGLHNTDDNRCPLGGVERFPNIWTNTTYAEDNTDSLRAEIAELRAALTERDARIESLQNKVTETVKTLLRIAELVQ